MAASVACCLPGAVSSGDVAGRPLAGALWEEALFLAVHTYCTRCFPPDARALRDAKLHAWVSGPLCSSFLNCTAALSFTRVPKRSLPRAARAERPSLCPLKLRAVAPLLRGAWGWGLGAGSVLGLLSETGRWLFSKSAFN